jgi:hypothetical protein
MSRFWGYSKRPKNWKKILEEDDEPRSSKKSGVLKPVKPVTNRASLPLQDSTISYMSFFFRIFL